MIVSVLLNLVLTVLLCTCALVGDHVGLRIHPSHRGLKALVDNGVHALIGGFTWMIVCVSFHRKGLHLQDLWQVIGCTLLASFIDIDHFIAARSFKLQDATNLNERPFLHSTTLVCICGVLLILITVLYPSLHPWGWVWLAASLSHHTRDATRRGYSFFPWGETPAISMHIYLLILSLLPHAIAMSMSYFRPSTTKLNTDEYVQVV